MGGEGRAERALICVTALPAVQFPTTRTFDARWWEVYDDVYERLGEGRGPQQLSAECKRDFMAVSR